MTRLELLYDLVFVFAFLNVTELLADELSVLGLEAGCVVLALLWWCWSGFAALGNLVRADTGVLPLIGIGIMSAVLVLALATPRAFIDQSDDLPGPLVFALTYLTIRALTIATFWCVWNPATRSRRDLWFLAVPATVAGGLVLAGALIPYFTVVGQRTEALVRLGAWLLALVVEYALGFLLPYAGWSLTSAGHWAERHAQIVLVALGESVIALGLGPGQGNDLDLSGPVIGAAVLGIALVGTLWWLHFDSLAMAVEQAVHGTRDRVRVPLIRDVYTYLHLPLIIAIVFTALGLKVLVTTVAGPRQHLHGDEIGVLYGAVTLFLLTEAAIVVRTFRRLRPSWLLAAGTLIALAFAAAQMRALAALGLLTGVCLLLAMIQRVTGRAARDRVRESALREHEAEETELSRWRRHHL
ncbi:low temperature requirement protein A [Plantactinospora sp. GCM10030261]|uniref:low temperature requirement protein A n=1 Tax=Plantactinospora sp. GCM10030261 TaxID=3273420 RepID=UPI00360F3D88